MVRGSYNNSNNIVWYITDTYDSGFKKKRIWVWQDMLVMAVCKGYWRKMRNTRPALDTWDPVTTLLRKNECMLNYWFIFFWYRVLLCSSGWPGAWYIDQASLVLRDSPASVSYVLKLNAVTSMSSHKSAI